MLNGHLLLCHATSLTQEKLTPPPQQEGTSSSKLSPLPCDCSAQTNSITYPPQLFLVQVQDLSQTHLIEKLFFSMNSIAPVAVSHHQRNLVEFRLWIRSPPEGQSPGKCRMSEPELHFHQVFPICSFPLGVIITSCVSQFEMDYLDSSWKHLEASLWICKTAVAKHVCILKLLEDLQKLLMPVFYPGIMIYLSSVGLIEPINL